MLKKIISFARRIANRFRSGEKLTKIFIGEVRELDKMLKGKVTDGFLELLLAGMKLWLTLFYSFRRRNLKGFRATYVFQTKDKTSVSCSVTFNKGRMKWKDGAVKEEERDVTVTFADSSSLFNYLLSPDHDILALVLKNEVEVDGNLNLVYKFMYIARHIVRPLGIT